MQSPYSPDQSSTSSYQSIVAAVEMQGTMRAVFQPWYFASLHVCLVEHDACTEVQIEPCHVAEVISQLVVKAYPNGLTHITHSAYADGEGHAQAFEPCLFLPCPLCILIRMTVVDCSNWVAHVWRRFLELLLQRDLTSTDYYGCVACFVIGVRCMFYFLFFMNVGHIVRVCLFSHYSRSMG